MTREQIKQVLRDNDRAVDRAMVVLYQRQTIDERSISQTKHSNGVGFSAADASLGTYFARYVLKGRPLTGQWLAKARRMALHYSGQLLEAAKIKEAQKQANPSSHSKGAPWE